MSNPSGWLPKLRRLSARLRPGELRFDEPTLKAHAGDKWFASNLPTAVALPKSKEAVQAILSFANKHKIPVTARGAGYGYVGGCVPSNAGIVLSLAKMNRIIEVHAGDFVAVVQPGVITQTLQERAEALGLFYPPDPASKADCSLGGNVATNAGGPRCLKYGVTRDYVLGLEVVLADGSICRLGGRVHKNKTGFDAARFFVGSEGMLGVVTEITFKLLPHPPFRACLGVGFKSMREAAKAIGAIFAAGVLPSALELADGFTLSAARKRTGSKLLEGCNAHFIVELDGQEKSVRGEIPALEKIIRNYNPVFVNRGYGDEGCENFWKLRREFSFSLRDTGLTKLNQDIVVPRSKLVELFDFAASLQKRHGVQVACFGHAGDGNIHVNIMIDPADPESKNRSEPALDALFKKVLAMGGAITGEHGIGIAKARWWPLAASESVRELHRRVKHALDPNNILNPGKFV